MSSIGTASTPRIQMTRLANGSIKIDLTQADPSINLILKRSTNLSTWNPLQTLTTTATGTTTYTDTTPPANKAFYRFYLP